MISLMNLGIVPKLQSRVSWCYLGKWFLWSIQEYVNRFLSQICSWERENDPFQWLTLGSKSSCNSLSVHGQKEGVRCQSLCSHSDHPCSSRTKTDIAKLTFYAGLFFLKFRFYWNRSLYILWNQRQISTCLHNCWQILWDLCPWTRWVPSAKAYGNPLSAQLMQCLQLQQHLQSSELGRTFLHQKAWLERISLKKNNPVLYIIFQWFLQLIGAQGKECKGPGFFSTLDL